MKDLRGKTVFITGGAAGIGLAMAEAFGREGMNVMIADIEPNTLAKAVETLRSKQVKAEGVVADVASRTAMREAALKTIEKFGKVHVVCNNAGVATGGPIGEVPERDWDWILDVNIKGVVYGMEVFAPLIESHGEGGHFVNTASMAGHVASGALEPYNATKFAVVGMSEGWAQQLAAKNIGVSILCPGFVTTQIALSRRNRQGAYGGEKVQDGLEKSPVTAAIVQEAGIPPSAVAGRVVEAVKDNDLYVFTHTEFRPFMQMRFQNLMAAFDKSDESPSLKPLPPRTLTIPTPE